MLDKTAGIEVYQASIMSASSIVFSKTNEYTTITNKLFATPVADPGTNFVYANVFSTLNPVYVSTRFVRLFKVDITNPTALTETNYGSGSYSYVNTWFNSMVVYLIDFKVHFIDKSTMAIVFTISDTNLGYFAIAEPTDSSTLYMSSKNAFAGEFVGSWKPVSGSSVI